MPGSSSLSLSLALALAMAVALITGAAAAMQPEQAHLAFGGSPAEVTLMFATANSTTGYNPIVMYGTESGSLSHTVQGTSAKSKCMTEGPAQHMQVLTGLTAATKYYYRFGDATQGMSEEFSFTTQPEVGTEKPVDFVWYGDMGVSNSNWTVAAVNKLVQEEDIEFIIHVGDLSYADDRIALPPGFWTQYQPVLNEFYNIIQPMAARVPYMTTVGNHEWPCSFSEYFARLTMPYKQSKSTDPSYYSFNHGRVHFIMLNTEQLYGITFIGPTTSQYKWLEADLKAASAMKAAGEIDWILAFAHRPLYCSYHWTACCWFTCDNGNSSSWDNLYRKNVEPLLVEHGVDMFLNGHTHNYERTLPIYKNEVQLPAGSSNDTIVDPKFPIYVTAGAAGDMEIAAHHWLPQPDWSVSRISTVVNGVPNANAGYARVTAHNGTSLEFQFIRASDGDVQDHFWIQRTN